MWIFKFFNKSKESELAVNAEPIIHSRAEVMKEMRHELAKKATASELMFLRDNDDEVSFLNRQATKLASEGKLDEAVLCLRKVASIKAEEIKADPSEGVRLALYLQKAGKVNEALAQMKHLIEMVSTAADAYSRDFKSNSLNARARFEADQYARLFDKLRLIMQREGMTERANMCQQLAQKWLNRSSALYQAYVMRRPVKIPTKPHTIDLRTLLIF